MPLPQKQHAGFWPQWRENRLFSLLLAILMVYGIVFLAFSIKNESLKSPTIGKAPAERRTISFDGTGKVVGTPDIATVDLGMTTQSKDVGTALSDNNKKINDLLSQLKQLGIASADIQTSHFNLYPNYDYTKPAQAITGYTADQGITVKIRDLAKVPNVLDAAGRVGANQVSGLSFTIDKPEALQADARKMAIDDAVSKAAVLGEQLGVTLAKVVNFSEANGNAPQPVYTSERAAGGAGGSSPSSVQIGSQDIVSNVTLTFEIAN
jgi:uncharacterized protein